MVFSKINELKPYDLNCNIFDVYSYDGLSMQELLCQFFTKINECIKTSNETIDLAEWLVNEGLKQEVALKLNEWLNDGTFENLINVTLFENLNNKIDNVSSQLEQNKNETNKQFAVIENKIEEVVFYPTGSFQLIVRGNVNGLQDYIDYINNIDTNKVKNMVLVDAVASSQSSITRPWSTLEELEILINLIKSRGISISAIKFNVTNSNETKNNPHEFMRNYVREVKKDVDLCVKKGINHLIFANEMPNFTAFNEYKEYFIDVINYAHSANIKIISASSYNEVSNITFLNDVDYIGINTYPSLSDRGTFTNIEDAKRMLYNSNQIYEMVELAKKYNKQFWLTEIGCTNFEYALKRPSRRDEETVGSGYYPEMQYIFYSCVLEYFGQASFNGKPLIDNLCIFSLLDYKDVYSPLNNEQAMEVIDRYFNHSINSINSRELTANGTNVRLDGESNYKLLVYKDVNNNKVVEYDYKYNNCDNKKISGFIFGQTKNVYNNLVSILNPRLKIKSINRIDFSESTNTSTTSITKLDDGLLTSNNNAGYSSFNIKAINLQVGKEYYLSIDYDILSKSTDDDNIGISIRGNTSSSSELDFAVGYGGRITKTFTAKFNTHYIRIMVTNGTTDTSKKVLLRNITCFEETLRYNSANAKNVKNYNSEQVFECELKEYDYIDLANKKINKLTKTITLTGSEDYVDNSNSNSNLITVYTKVSDVSDLVHTPSGASHYSFSMCDKLSFCADGSINNTYYFRNYGNTVRLYLTFDKGFLNNVDSVKNWINKNNLNFIYKVSDENLEQKNIFVTERDVVQENTIIQITSDTFNPKFLIY